MDNERELIYDIIKTYGSDVAEPKKLCSSIQDYAEDYAKRTNSVNNTGVLTVVSKRYYWLKADGTISNMWDEKTHKETIDDEMMEIAKQKGWSLIQINVC